MSMWLGKSRIEEADLKGSIPSIVEHFPMLARYYMDNQKLRLYLILPYEMGDRFTAAVTKTYGSINPTSVRKAGLEALEAWIQGHK